MEQNFVDLYNYNQIDNGNLSQDKIDSLVKAMSAGEQTGRDLTGQDTSGSALKLESLDPTLKVITNTDKHIKFWKLLPKEKAYNTVQEFNQLKDYGLDVGIFNGEGETPQFNDSIYVRNSRLVKYMGVSGEVTDPYTLVNVQGGNQLAKEVYNKSQFLIRAVDKALPIGDSSLVSSQFDGYFKQHYDGIVGTGGTLDDYANSSNVIDLRGEALTETALEDATSAVVNDGYGEVSQIVANPTVFNNFAKRFLDAKRVMVNNPTGAVTDAVMGQRVSKIATQFGNLDMVDDIFFDRQTYKMYNSAATNAKAPAKPIKDGSTPIAVVTDTNTKFTDGASTYWYLVTSKNRYGESQVEVINTSGQAVTATQAVNLKFSITNNAYDAESYVIYRTEAGVTDYTTAKYWPVMEVSVAQLASGYDGGAAGLVRDRNRKVPNTTSALVLNISTDVLNFYQLAPLRRMDLAFTAPAYRFMILLYGTPAIFAPKKISRIVNIGSTIS